MIKTPDKKSGTHHITLISIFNVAMSSIKCKQAREEEIYTKKTTLLSIFAYIFHGKRHKLSTLADVRSNTIF
jgi:hypothetical protein